MRGPGPWSEMSAMTALAPNAMEDQPTQDAVLVPKTVDYPGHVIRGSFFVPRERRIRPKDASKRMPDLMCEDTSTNEYHEEVERLFEAVSSIPHNSSDPGQNLVPMLRPNLSSKQKDILHSQDDEPIDVEAPSPAHAISKLESWSTRQFGKGV